MRRIHSLQALTLALVTVAVPSLRADVRTEQTGKFQFGGALGRMVNMFGGSAARDGVTSVVAVKGNRKMTSSPNSGQIIDLGEEKIYDLDLRRKQYTVLTFAQYRQRIEDAAKKAAASSGEAPSTTDAEQTALQVEVDFTVTNTGATKTINGFSTHDAVMTVTVRQKGKTLEQGGGLVLTSTLWLTDTVAAMAEIQDFDRRYAEKLFGPMLGGASAQDLATALAMYPAIKPALARLADEGRKLQGTPIATTTVVESVPDPAQKQAASSAGGGGSTPTSVGGLLGGFGKRLAQRQAQGGDSGAGNGRTMILTTSTEVLSIATRVADTDVALPAGLKLAQ